MTIRELSRQYDATVASQHGPANVAIAFAFDSSYLKLFKTCIVSMMHTSNFLDSPVIIYTDDPDVLEDPVVEKCADRKVLVSGARKERLESLAQNNVKRPERAGWNRGTFLKWSVFENHAHDTVVFFDVDIIFLEKFDDELLGRAIAPFTAVPQFQRELIKEEGKARKRPAEQKWLLDEVIEGRFSDKMKSSVNSGVLVLNGKVLTDEFFEEIASFASGQLTINEQQQFSRYFRKRSEELCMISGRFNFQEHYLDGLSWADQKDLFDKISVLHYTGKPKPWDIWPKNDFRPTTALWHWHRSLAEHVFGADS